ncbi:Protein involved in cell division [Actinomyces viscosus]|uniref:Protein involved in cell division n=1 Tax=Actinomyces viscosus TaxID=1656 RepID=A0A3S4XAT8_ACTVI|nr:Protein involved in cell division [Actinomyces viscosus]
MDHGSATADSRAAASWPQVAWETLPWQPRDSAALSSRQRSRLPSTYDSAVVPSIADVVIDLPAAVMAREAAAVAAVARFDAAAASALLPFTALLLRSESSASSRIERLTSSARRIVEEETFGGDRRGGNAALIVANARAMETATAAPWPPDLDSLLSMHRALLKDSDPTIAGRLRQEPVWIGGSDLSPADALFAPPHHSQVPAALKDLLSFMRRPDLPPLTKVALTHAQLETIHPFADGNGRTGRALTHVLLAGEGLSRTAPLPLSAVLLTDVDTYFRALDDYRSGSPLPIVELFINAAQRAAELGSWAGQELDAVQQQMQDRVSSRAGTPDRDLVRLLTSQPVVDVRGAAAALGVSEQAARRALERLEGSDVVQGYQVSRGRRAWRAQDVLDLMDEVAMGIGRRQPPASPTR